MHEHVDGRHPDVVKRSALGLANVYNMLPVGAAQAATVRFPAQSARVAYEEVVTRRGVMDTIVVTSSHVSRPFSVAHPVPFFVATLKKLAKW